MFSAALKQPPADRGKFLAAQCEGDHLLRAEVEALLQLHESTGDFLNTPLPELLGARTRVRQDLPAGTLLKSRYRIQQPIADSGFATVYLATDDTLAGKPVVIKLLDRIYNEQALRDTFEPELRSLCRVHHPNVVGISDAGELDGGTPFLVLGYVPGITLREALRGGQLPVPRAGSIVQGIGQALVAAHRAGVWHLDLKPENIILSEHGTPDERVTVIDFGIARLKELPNRELSAWSPLYMAPEQTENASAKSDVYTLGRVAFEIFTGRLPDSNAKIEDQLPKAVGPNAIAAVAQALQADPNMRVTSVAEFLKRYTAEPPVHRRKTWLIAISAFVLGGSVLFFVSTRLPAPSASNPLPLVTTPGFEYQPSFSADGKSVFYAAGPPGRLQISRTEIGGGDPLRLVD